MSQFLFVSGQIRALESKLINSARLERMVGAKTPEDAFRVLVELQYAEYFDDSLQASQFPAILEQGLIETKKLLENGMDHHPGLQFLWLKEDLNNLKRALKSRLEEEQASLTKDTEEDQGYSKLGDISFDSLENIVFNEVGDEKLVPELAVVIASAQELFEPEGFQALEFAMDQAYAVALKRIAKEAKSIFLTVYAERIIDSANIRNIARSLAFLGGKVDENALLAGGSASPTNIQSWDDLKQFTSQSHFNILSSEIKTNEEMTPDDVLALEKGLDRIMNRFLEDSESGEIDSVQIPICYFEKRMRNARMIKFVLYAKFHGLSSEAIWKTLKNM